MRISTKTIRNAALFAASALALAACEAQEQTGESAVEPDAMEAEGSDLTEGEIEEAVPGIEDVDPEGNAPSNADLNDEENADYSDIEDPEDYQSSEEPVEDAPPE